jgi:hypothetical protein
MSNSILITRPNYDITTNYLFYWTELVISFSTRHNAAIYDLSGSKANRTNLESYNAKRRPKIIFLNGHGSSDVITGQDDEEIITSADKDLSRYQNCIFYARSCQSANNLGVSLVDKGVSAFIGYKEDFIFFRNENYSTKPLKDPIARYFLDPSNLVMTTLIKGNSVKEADKRSKRSMTKNFLKLLTSTSSTDDRDTAPYLWSNIRAQVVLGDESDKILV